MKRLLLAILLLGGCSTTGSPSQQVYALEVEYEVAASAAVAYVAAPGADKSATADILAADNTAHAALVAARSAVEAGGDRADAITEGAIAGAQTALLQLTALLPETKP